MLGQTSWTQIWTCPKQMHMPVSDNHIDGENAHSEGTYIKKKLYEQGKKKVNTATKIKIRHNTMWQVKHGQMCYMVVGELELWFLSSLCCNWNQLKWVNSSSNGWKPW